MKEETKKYAVQVTHKNAWTTTIQRFETIEEAKKWAEWNYRGNKNYRIVNVEEF